MTHFFGNRLEEFLEGLSSLVSAGIPVRNALETLGANPRGRVSGLARALAERIHAGSGLGEALEAERFPPALAALVHAGERSGTLDRVLVLALERWRGQRRATLEFLRQVAWPICLLLAALVLIPSYLVVMGEGTTYLAIQFAFFGSVLALVAVGGVLARRSGSRSLRRSLERVLFRIPLVGTALQDLAFARSLETLGLLLAGLGSIEEALRLAAHASVSVRIEEALASVPERLRRGQTFALALVEVLASFPRTDWVSRLHAAEVSGALDGSLGEIARDLAERGSRSIALLAKLLSVLITLLVGCVVLARAIQVFSGISGGE